MKTQQLKTHAARFPLPAVEFTFAGFTWPRYVATLPAGDLRARLAARRETCCGPYFHAPQPLERFARRGFYLSDAGAPGMRWAWCDDVPGVGIRHSGWFYNDCGDTIRGLVFRLPNNRGYLPGWSMGEGMASALDYSPFETEEAAAWCADNLAETAAENQREYEETETEECA